MNYFIRRLSFNHSNVNMLSFNNPKSILQGGSMFTIRSFVSVLALCGIVAAADPTSTAVPPSGQQPPSDTAAAKAPAGDLVIPAPAVEPAPAAPAAAKPAAPALDITWYGMAMLRFREEIVINYKKGVSSMYTTPDTVEAASTLSQRLAYKFGAKIKPNKDLLMQFELGNDWVGTEDVLGMPGNYLGKRGGLYPWFSLAYALWDPGYLHVGVGIIPVKRTVLLDLLGVSLLYNRTYRNAAHLTWGDITNLSQTGLRIGAPILKDDFKLGTDLMIAVVQQRPAIVGKDTMKINYPAWEFLLELPMEAAGLTLTPQVFAIPYRSFNKVTKKGDFEYGAGVDFGYKINDNVKLRAGFGMAQNSNYNSNGDNDTVLTDPLLSGSGTRIERTAFLRLGTNSNIGTTIKIGPGKLDFDFNFSSDYNAKDTNVEDIYPFVDLKYGWSVNKNFVIMPRCRLFFSYPKAAYASKLTTRPEIIFVGSF
jgi:hypothetical protein